MCYLKIFPKIFNLEMMDINSFNGVLIYDYELYGAVHSSVHVNIYISRNSGGVWRLSCASDASILIGFETFLIALNYYLFSVIGFSPSAAWVNNSSAYYAFHFERVYFDLSIKKFLPFEFDGS